MLLLIFLFVSFCITTCDEMDFWSLFSHLFLGGARTKQPSEFFLEKPAVAHVSNVALKAKPFSGVFMVTQGWRRSFLPYLKALETNSALTSEGKSVPGFFVICNSFLFAQHL